jgi:hypothetical protein
MSKKFFIMSALTFCLSAQAEVISGTFILEDGKCSESIINKLKGDTLTLVGTDSNGKFTRKYERDSKNPIRFIAIDGLGGSIKYTGANTLVAEQPDIGLICKYKRAN